MENCENCGSELTGCYCAACGEDNKTPRLTLKSIFKEFFSSFLSYDSGFNTTLRMLLLEPGVLIRNYISGIRSPYYHPIRLLLIFATLNAIVFVQFDIMEAVAFKTPDTEEEKVTFEYMTELMNKYMNLMSIGIIPFIAIVSRVFLRERKYNLAEHLLIYSYLYAFVLVIGIALTPLQLLFFDNHVVNTILSMGPAIVYLVYGQLKVFEQSISVAIKGFLAYMVSMIIFIIVVTVAVFFKLYYDLENDVVVKPDRTEFLHGYWELEAMEKADTLSGGWVPYREGGMTGTLLYDNAGHVSLHLEPINYFYTGTYELLKGDTIVEHTRLTHSDSSEVGVTVQRKISFAGDTLVIRPVEEQNATLRLKWLKRAE